MKIEVIKFFARILASLAIGFLYASIMALIFEWDWLFVLFGPLFLFVFEIVLSIIFKREEKKYQIIEASFPQKFTNKHKVQFISSGRFAGYLYLFSDRLLFISIDKKPMLSVEIPLHIRMDLQIKDRILLVIEGYVFSTYQVEKIAIEIEKLIVDKSSSQ